MKPAPFAYDAPASLDEAVTLLARHGDEAKVLAGGQSLIPLLALRMAMPSRLVDLNRIPSLAGIRALEDGGLAIGAMTRTHALEVDPLVSARAPLVAEATPLIAHRAIRNRGTVGGAVAHADPAAELPAVMLALGATIVATGPAGTREIPAADFFQGVYTTALAADEILTELRVPAPAPGSGSAFLEVARRSGDFAMAGAAVVVTFEGERCAAARVALIGVADRPAAVPDAAAAVIGTTVDEAAAAEAGRVAAASVNPSGDLHASAEYRRALVAVLVRRGLLLAVRRARDSLKLLA